MLPSFFPLPDGSLPNDWITKLSAFEAEFLNGNGIPQKWHDNLDHGQTMSLNTLYQTLQPLLGKQHDDRRLTLRGLLFFELMCCSYAKPWWCLNADYLVQHHKVHGRQGVNSDHALEALEEDNVPTAVRFFQVVRMSAEEEQEYSDVVGYLEKCFLGFQCEINQDIQGRIDGNNPPDEDARPVSIQDLSCHMSHPGLISESSAIPGVCFGDVPFVLAYVPFLQAVWLIDLGLGVFNMIASMGRVERRHCMIKAATAADGADEGVQYFERYYTTSTWRRVSEFISDVTLDFPVYTELMRDFGVPIFSVQREGDQSEEQMSHNLLVADLIRTLARV